MSFEMPIRQPPKKSVSVSSLPATATLGQIARPAGSSSASANVQTKAVYLLLFIPSYLVYSMAARIFRMTNGFDSCGVEVDFSQHVRAVERWGFSASAPLVAKRAR